MRRKWLDHREDAKTAFVLVALVVVIGGGIGYQLGCWFSEIQAAREGFPQLAQKAMKQAKHSSPLLAKVLGQNHFLTLVEVATQSYQEKDKPETMKAYADMLWDLSNQIDDLAQTERITIPVNDIAAMQAIFDDPTSKEKLVAHNLAWFVCAKLCLKLLQGVVSIQLEYKPSPAKPKDRGRAVFVA